MAKQLNSYQVNLQFTADSKQAQQQLQNLQSQLTSLINQASATGSTLGVTKEIQEGINAAAQLKVKLQEATDVNTGKLDLTKFSHSLDRSKIKLKDYANTLSDLGPEGAEAFMSLARSISMADAPLFKVRGLLGDLFVTLKNTARWQISSSILHGFMGAVSTAYGYAQDLNKSLNNIRIVTGQSSEEMAKFAKEANTAAKALSTTTTKYTDAALIYYQQGLDDEQVKERTDITIKMANVARESAETVSDQMTAVWNNFYDGSQSLEHYADAMVRLGADTASSTDEIAGGLEKFAAVANTIGLSFDNAAATLATITATTRQSEDVVGTSLKTIFARIQGLKLGDTLEDGTTLNQYSQALEKVGINIKDSSGELKDMDDLLQEMGEKWNTISKSQQVALAQQVAGVRQYTQLIALMDNFDYYQENLERAQNADGSLDKQADIYAESWEAAGKRLRASLESVFTDIISDDFFIDLTDALAKIVNAIDWLIDSLGGLKGLLATISTIVFKLMGNQIASKLRDVGDSLSMLTASGREKVNNKKKEALNAAMGVSVDDGTNFGAVRGDNMKQEITLQNILLENEEKMSEEEKKIYSLRLDSIRAMQKQTEEQAKNLDLLQDEEDAVKQSLMYRQRQRIARGETGISEEEYKKAISDYNMYNETYGRVNYFQRKTTTGNGVTSSFQNLGEVKRFINKQLSEMQGVAMTSTQNPNEKSAATEAFRPFLNSLKEFDESVTDITGQDKLKKFFESVNENIGEGKTNLELFIDGFEELKRAIVEAGEVSVQDPWLESDQETGEEFDQLGERARRAGQAAEELSGSIDHVDESAKKMGDDMQKPKEQMDDWATTMTAIGSSLSQTAMAISAINSIFDTIKDGGMTLDSLINILFSFSMLLPVIANLLEKESYQAGVAAIKQIFYGKASEAAAAGTMSFSVALKSALPLLAALTVGIAIIVKICNTIAEAEDRARERIDEATKSYKEQQSALESLNEELKNIKDRIDELNSQDILSITDKEDLENLQKQQKLLEKQVELQDKLAKAKQKTQAEIIRKNYKTGNKTLLEGPNFKGMDLTQSAEDWYEEKSKQGYSETYLKTGKRRREEAEKIRDEWLSENAEAIQQAEEDFQSYMDAVTSGAIEFNKEEIANLTETITNIRKNIYSDGEYEEIFLEPLLDDATFKNISDSIYKSLESGGIEDAASLISSSFKNQLAMAGVSVEDFLTFLDEQVDQSVESIKEKFQGQDTEKFFNSLTSKDWKILASINIDNFDSLEEVQEFLNNYKENDVNVNVYGLDDLKEVLTKINDSQSAMETALKAYKDQKGYLTMDQVETLLSADESYANYITKVGDAYKLTDGALESLLASEGKEKLLLDTEIEVIKERNKLNLDYVSNYIQLYDELINESSNFEPGKYSFSDENDAKFFNERTKELKKNAEAYKEGKITVDQYFDAINDRIKNIHMGFSNLDDEIDDNIDKTNLYEKTLSATTGSIAQGFIDLNKQLRSGAINMDSYYKGVTSGLRALITTESKLNKNIVKDAVSGTWKVKDGIDEVTIGTEEWEKAQQAVNDLNTWEKQLQGATDFAGAIDLFTEHYDYLVKHANEAGQIQFNIETNFDVASAEFQSFQQDLFTSLSQLEETAPEKFQRIADQMAETYTELADGTKITADRLAEFTVNNAEKVDTLTNTFMSDTLGSVTTASQAAGNVLSALGNLITNFDYTISFTPASDGNTKFSLLKWLTSGGKEGLPSFKYDIKGSGGNSVKDFAQSLQDAGQFLVNQVDGAPDTNRFGINNFGTSGKSNDGVLDYNKIKTDNIRDKNSSSKSTKKEVERYHEITREIQFQQKALERLEKVKDRVYGKKRLEIIQNEIDANKKLYKTQEELYNLVLADLPKDQQAVQKQFNGKGIFNKETNELKNYTQLYESATTEAQQKALTQYEKTLDKLLEQKAVLDDLKNTIQELHYEKLTYEVEVKIQLDENDTKKLEYYFDKLSDNIYKAAEALGYLQGQFDPVISQLGTYENFYGQLNNAYANGEISQENYIEGLQDVYDSTLDNLNALQDLDKEMLEYYGNTIDLANDELSKYTDHMEHLTSVLDHYRSIITLLGKDKDYDKVLSVLNGTAQTKKNNFDASKQWYESLKRERDAAAAALANSTDEAEREVLQKNYDAILAAFDEAEEDMLSKAEEYGEALKEILTTKMEQAADEMNKQLSTTKVSINGNNFNISGWDALNDALDRMSSYQDEYLTKTNQIYEMNKLLNNVNQAIDKTNNQAAKNRYQQFTKEIEQLRDKDKLSQLELEIAQAKYKVLEAQIALEEAQNAKSTVRLQRDNEGNFGYVYTADQEKVNDAQQALADAENDLYNIRLDATNKYGQQKLQYEKELAEKLAELDQKAAEDAVYRETTYQQERALVIQQYTDLITTAGNLYAKAQEEDSRVVQDAWVNSFDIIKDNSNSWKDTITENTNIINDTFKEWQDSMDEISKIVGDDLKDTQQKVKDVTDESNKLYQEVSNRVIPALENELSSVRSATEAWAQHRQQLLDTIRAYEELLNAIQATLRAQSGFGSDSGGDTDWAAMMGTVAYGSAQYNQYKRNREEKIANGGSINEDTTARVDAYYKLLSEGKISGKLPNGKYSFTQLTDQEWRDLVGFRSGGYTGTWNDDGKLAFLHQKELVLNADDTENMLASIQLVRQIAKQLDFNSQQISTLSSSGFTVSSQDGTLEQNVRIEASFPNATDRYEIQEAFNTLVNVASQYANRK